VEATRSIQLKPSGAKNEPQLLFTETGIWKSGGMVKSDYFGALSPPSLERGFPKLRLWLAASVTL